MPPLTFHSDAAVAMSFVWLPGWILCVHKYVRHGVYGTESPAKCSSHSWAVPLVDLLGSNSFGLLRNHG